MIPVMDPKHLELIQRLRANVRDIVPQENQNEDFFYLRWLKARDFNVVKAEAMMRKAFAWRIRNEFDVLLDWKPVQNYFRYAMAGHDLDGNPVFIIPIGLWDICGATELGDIVPSFKAILRMLAHVISEINLTAQRLGKPDTQATMIVDFQQLAVLRLLGNRTVVQAIIEICRIFENNFPETLKTCVLINTARVFPMLLAIAKPFISARTLAKFEIFGTQSKKWIPALEKRIPMNILPPHYGGTRAGCDEFCSDSEIWNNGPLPQNFYNTGDSASSTRSSSVDSGNIEGWKREEIQAGGKLELSFSVSAESTKLFKNELVWQVKSEDYDLGFQVTFAQNATKLDEVDEIIEYQRIDSHVTPNVGSLVCNQPGTYTLILDNSYSRRRNKIVHHNIYLSTVETES